MIASGPTTKLSRSAKAPGKRGARLPRARRYMPGVRRHREHHERQRARGHLDPYYTASRPAVPVWTGLSRPAPQRRPVASGADMAPLRIVEGSAKDIPALEPLLVAVHHVHQASMPELAPYVSDAETWAELRGHYDSMSSRSPARRCFSPTTARTLVGYALAHILDSVRRDLHRGHMAHRANESASSSRSRCA